MLLKAQLYKAQFVSIKEFDEFIVVGKNAYIDYNLSAMKVQLLLNDSIYNYQIKKTGKPLDSDRFVVYFEDSDDSMMWNTTNPNDYVIAFSINEKLYWLRNITNPIRQEFDWVKLKIAKE